MYQLLAQFAATIKNTVYQSLKLDQRQNGLMSFYSKISIPQLCRLLKYWLIDLNDLTLKKCAIIRIILTLWLPLVYFIGYIILSVRHSWKTLGPWTYSSNTWCQNKMLANLLYFYRPIILSTFKYVATSLMCTVIFVWRDFVIWLFC